MLLKFVNRYLTRVTVCIKLTADYNTIPLVAQDVHKAAAKQGRSNSE